MNPDTRRGPRWIGCGSFCTTSSITALPAPGSLQLWPWRSPPISAHSPPTNGDGLLTDDFSQGPWWRDARGVILAMVGILAEWWPGPTR